MVLAPSGSGWCVIGIISLKLGNQLPARVFFDLRRVKAASLTFGNAKEEFENLVNRHRMKTRQLRLFHASLLHQSA